MERIQLNRALASVFFAALLAVAAFAAEPVRAATTDETNLPEKTPEMEPTEENGADSSATPHEPSPVVIRGVVRDANGGPVRGATIRLMSETDTVQVQSDASGKFRVRLTAQHDVNILVRAYGYRDLMRTFPASRAGIQAALALPPPYPLGWVTVTMVRLPIEDPRWS